MTLKEFRGDFDLRPQEVASSVRYFFKNDIDWDVFLPTKGINLQRGFVWTLEQKRELIYSVFMGRHIPHCAIINIVNPKDTNKDIWQIIDGRQRLSTFYSFVNNEFTVFIGEKEFSHSELPKEYQNCIENFYFRYYVINEEWGKPITDEQKIAWFKFINFAGTPQDKQHMEKLNK